MNVGLVAESHTFSLHDSDAENSYVKRFEQRG